MEEKEIETQSGSDSFMKDVGQPKKSAGWLRRVHRAGMVSGSNDVHQQPLAGAEKLG